MRAEVVIEDNPFLAAFLGLARRQLGVWEQTSQALRDRVLRAVVQLLFVPFCGISLNRRADILARSWRFKGGLDVFLLDQKLFNLGLGGALHHGLNFGATRLLVYLSQL